MTTRRQVLMTLLAQMPDAPGFSLRGILTAEDDGATYDLGKDLAIIVRQGTVLHRHLRALAGKAVVLRLDES